MMRLMTWGGAAVFVLVTSACSPGGSSSPSAPAAAAAPAAPAASEFACSSPLVLETLQEIVWEGVETTIAQQLFADRVPDVTAAAKAHVRLSVEGVATVPGQNGARPTCEASLIGRADGEINPTIKWLQQAQRQDASVRAKGSELTGAVTYTVQPSDDGKTFRVSAQGTEPFAAALAGVGLNFRTKDIQAQFEAQKKAEPVPAALTPAEPAGEAEDPQATAAADYAAADKELNVAYQSARARLNNQQRAALKDEQRAWITRRDAECSESKVKAQSGGDVAGGSALAMEVVGCKTTMTQERTRQLRAKG